jgi:hypothetical protein
MRQQVNWTAKLSDEIKKTLSPDLHERLGVSRWLSIDHNLPLVPQLGVTANLGEAIMHLKYLDDQFSEDPARASGKSAAEEFAKSTHRY